MAIVKIQHRRGNYADYDPSKVLPGEMVVTLANDPNASDGRAVYIGTVSGHVKQLATVEDMEAEVATALDEAVPAAVSDATARAEAAAQSAAQSARTLTIDNTLTQHGQVPESYAAGQIVVVSDTQPSAVSNKMWLNPSSEEVEIPTIEDLESAEQSITNLQQDVVELEDSIDDVQTNLTIEITKADDNIANEFRISPNNTYPVGAYVIYEGILYVCNTETSARSWDPAKWTKVRIIPQFTTLRKDITGDYVEVSGTTTATVNFSMSFTHTYVFHNKGTGTITNVTAYSAGGGNVYTVAENLAPGEKVEVVHPTGYETVVVTFGSQSTLAMYDKETMRGELENEIYSIDIDVDDTLTEEGKAADAKKVGDEVSTIKADLSELPNVQDSTKTGVDLDVSDGDGNVIARFVNGHFQTKNFNSEETTGIKDSTKTGVDLDFSDPSGNVLMRLQNGHIITKNFDSSNIVDLTCYVSPNGLDTNSGDASHPFLTIQHAIDSGYNRIMLAPGEYKNQKVVINGKNGISIICNTSTKESNIFESHQRQARAKLDNSIDVSNFVAYNSIYRTALTVDSDSSYYKVFVSKTVDPVYSGSAYYGRVTTYNAILWEITDSILTCTRLVPKLTLADCEATQGSFFYDGTYLYVNPTGGSMTGKTYKRLNDDTFESLTRGFYIYNSTDIFIDGLDVQFFPYYDFHANLVSGLVMRDCGFYFTCYGSAAEYQNCNGDMWSCNAAQAGADGFGIASGGNASFHDCNAIFCYDDGISHHDEATGMIDGGIWTYCKKGGVTPSFGSHVTVKNVIATHNVYGIYWTQSGERVTDGVQYMQNCLAVDNTTKDIKITGYDVVSHGCSYGIKEVDDGATLTEYNSTVIS